MPRRVLGAELQRALLLIWESPKDAWRAVFEADACPRSKLRALAE